MRRSYIFLTVLSGIGLALTVVLMIDHFIPQTAVTLFACGGGSASSCSELSLSPWSEFMGIPIASFGFFFYIWIFLSLHLFREAGERYWNTFVYLLVPVAALGLLFDLVLGGILVYLQIFCILCVSTYAVNILIFVVTFFEYRRISSETGIGLLAGVRSLPKLISGKDDRVFSTGTVVYYSVILFLFVVSFSLFLGEKYGDNRQFAERQVDYLEEYRNRPQKTVDLPETPFISGEADAGLVIQVFTDPLCGACRVFHGMEKKLLEQYRGRVQFHSYYFPALNCDPVTPSISCRSTLVMFAAGRADVYDGVLVNHFDRYDTMKRLYREDASYGEIIAELVANEADQEAVLAHIGEESTFDMMRSHIDLAKSLHLSATPTLIINGRILEGFPKMEYMKKIIEWELSQMEK
ncbi:MAG: vitamin K epoxide reductase family protein [Spirochaetota bacterium]